MASRAATFDDCRALDADHVWDDGAPRGEGRIDVIGEWLFGCMSRVNSTIPVQSHFTFGERPTCTVKQGLIMELVNKQRRDAMLNNAGIWDKARLQAAAAAHSGAWLEAPPNAALDMQLSNAEVQYGVGRRLGVALCEECPCPFCLGVMDKYGAHCETCMTGGDKTVNHNEVRDDTYIHARRAHTAPRLEACGVSRLLGLQVVENSQERPADVLLVRAQDITTGMGTNASRVALDIGIICPQAFGHLGASSAEPCGAAEEYARTKCTRGDIARRCADAGVVFQPMIFESMGGVSSEADRVLKCLNKAVAVNTDSSEEAVATRFWQRIGIDILRGNCRSFHRRLVKGGPRAGAGHGYFQSLAGLAFASGI